MATANRGPTKGQRIWPRIMLGLVVLAVGLGWYYHADVMAQTGAGTAYGARVGCSCRFVEGRALRDCRKDFEPGMSMVRLSEDREAKSVTASVPLLASATATYRQGFGCVLERWHR